MNALREREINNNLERRLSEEQKLRGESGWENLWVRFDCHNSLGEEGEMILSRRQKASSY